MTIQKVLRENDLAGRWYPSSARELRAMVDEALTPESSSVALLPGVRALIVPHAGYVYSGAVAGHAYRQIADAPYRRVIVLGPTHRVRLENMAALDDATHYGTPLGETPLDLPFIEALLKHRCFTVSHRAVIDEHSVQIQLPFLQVALPEFQLVPIVVGQLDAQAIEEIADALRKQLDDETLVVVSSDFTHYGPNYGFVPFDDHIEKNLEKLDMGAVAEIGRQEPIAFERYVDYVDQTICGHSAIGVLLAMAGKALETHMLAYDTSGRMTGGFKNSVSYLALALTGSWPNSEIDAPSPPEENELSADEKQTLLALAREALEGATRHPGAPLPEPPAQKLTPALRNLRAAFVTLRVRGELRGCIGEIEPTRPLYESVITNAINAARRDSRFSSVEPSEVPNIDIEISALTPPRPVSSYQDIVVGKHGILLEKHGHRAVFLPQVATEQGWNLETTMRYLCRKAGLAQDDYLEDARLQVFAAEAFSEND